MDALEVHQPGVPELELDPGQRVQPVQQVLRRVLAQHVPDLVGPVDDDGLDGVQQGAVQGRGEPAEQRAGVLPALSLSPGSLQPLWGGWRIPHVSQQGQTLSKPCQTPTINCWNKRLKRAPLSSH